MRIYSSKLVYSLSVFLAVTIIFHACTKDEIKNRDQLSYNADASTVERTKQAIIKSGQSITVTVPVNEKASDVYFSDAQNNRIDMLTLAHNAEASRISVCDYQYDPNGDPIEDMFPANFNLNSTGYIYDCGSGSSNYREVLLLQLTRITIYWRITS